MYKAIVCKIKNVRAHPNGDRLRLATVQGFQIIVGLDQEEGELGVFFPSDGCLLKDHCVKNNLYRKNPDTGEEMGGYFGPNGRVKALKLRGSISEGFWQPISSFKWTGSTSALEEGYEFDTLNGHKICEKYFTPATKNAMSKKNKKGKTNTLKVDRSMMHEHYSTEQLRYYINKIPKGALIGVTLKMHGTSGRTGLIKSTKLKYNPAKLGWNNLVWRVEDWMKKLSRKHKFLKPISKIQPKTFTLVPKEDKKFWEYVSGSRKVVIDPDKEYVGYYNGDPFREKIHKQIVDLGLKKGEVLYYEIVGYTENGSLIMGNNFEIEDKKMKKQYGKKMRFTYGCEEGQCKIYVYRIAHITEDGHEIDLPRSLVEARCEQLGLNVVPEMCESFIYDGDKEKLAEKLQPLTDGPDPTDNRHTREGIVVRVEHKDMFNNFKWKGETFCEVESIAKQNPNFIDTEEIS